MTNFGKGVLERLQSTPFREGYFQYHCKFHNTFLDEPSNKTLEKEFPEQVSEQHDGNPGPSNFHIAKEHEIDDIICCYIEESGKYKFSLSELQDFNGKKKSAINSIFA